MFLDCRRKKENMGRTQQVLSRHRENMDNLERTHMQTPHRKVPSWDWNPQPSSCEVDGLPEVTDKHKCVHSSHSLLKFPVQEVWPEHHSHHTGDDKQHPEGDGQQLHTQQRLLALLSDLLFP